MTWISRLQRSDSWAIVGRLIVAADCGGSFVRCRSDESVWCRSRSIDIPEFSSSGLGMSCCSAS